MFFSHPAVEGVILWHFWDGSNWHQNEALFNGPGITVALMQPIAVEKVEIVQLKTLYILCLSLQPNAAGQKYLDLVQGSWRSHIKRRLDQDHPVNVTMFKGDYVMHVRQNGHVIHQENFTVDSSGKDLTVHLTGQHQSKIYNLISNNTVFAYI